MRGLLPLHPNTNFCAVHASWTQPFSDVHGSASLDEKLSLSFPVQYPQNVLRKNCTDSVELRSALEEGVVVVFNKQQKINKSPTLISIRLSTRIIIYRTSPSTKK